MPDAPAVETANQKPWYRKLHWQVIIALVAGAAFGRLAPDAAAAIGFIGDLFLRLLKMIIIPLIFTSLVSGIASLGLPAVIRRASQRSKGRARDPGNNPASSGTPGLKKS